MPEIMTKKIILGISLVLIISVALFGWTISGPGTAFKGKNAVIQIPTVNKGRSTVESQLNKENILAFPFTFNLLAANLEYWDNIKPGQYIIKKGMSNLDIIRMLRNGSQAPVNLVINKFRTREDLAGFIGRKLECDSADLINFFNMPDSTRIFGLDTNNILTAIIPNTYTMYWNTSVSKLLRRLYSERETFWNKERLSRLRQVNLTKEQAYILASIIEEETNKHDEKPLIASVYLNRLKKNMSLSADPTIKFALRNFGLKRITLKHINACGDSPYNTYKNRGLPPGPISTPSEKTIDAVLNVANTDYLFFCAKADFSGYHSFASNEQDHFRNAREYQRALDSLLIK
jgi:UPF0755 protein